VNQQKQNEGRESKEVEGPGRLVTAKQIQQEWVRRSDCRGHREARRHHQRQDDEHDTGVCQFLQQPIRRSSADCADNRTQVVLQILQQCSWRELATARNQGGCDVAAGDSDCNIRPTYYNKYPRSQKMQAPGPAVLIEDVVVALGGDRSAGHLREDHT
jgi:hypothetical protein